MKLIQRLTKEYNDTLNILSQFDGNFMAGFAGGVMALSVLIYRALGVNFALTPFGQMHLVSLDLCFLLIPIGYYFFKFEQNNGKRVLISLMLPIFIFSIHDVLWLIESYFIPQVFKVPITLTLAEYSYHYCKNFVNIILSFSFLYKYFKVNWKFLTLLAGQIVFHLINIYFQIDIYVLNGWALIIMETIDTLPYLALIKNKKEDYP